MTSEILEFAMELINKPSITPNDNGCQALLIERLKKAGFVVEKMDSGPVSNFWAYHGSAKPLVAFSGHTDVVPPGPEDQWHSPPFSACVRNNRLYGRGAADMKGALAAMLIGCERFIRKHPKYQGSIGFMVTSDEEGEAKQGTAKIIEQLTARKTHIEYCLIGEASSNEKAGDAIKIGRRGSLHGHLQVIGKQGHIAYPQEADNPIHRSFKALDALAQMKWDEGNDFFSPTSFQIYNIQADTGATNLIPGCLTAKFNFRFSPASTAETLKERTHALFDSHRLNYKIHWTLSSNPFLSQNKALVQATKQAIEEICNLKTHVNTTGGTSDGRFIAPTGAEVVELGPSNQSIHQVNENVSIKDLEILAQLYERILEKLLIEPS